MGDLCAHFFVEKEKLNIAYKIIPVRPDRKNSDLVNEEIRFPEVRVIGPEGEQLGIMPRSHALNRAESYNLDLLCVSATSNPPVCKIVDYGKYRFEQQKRKKEAKKNQKIIEIKEVQLTPQIGDHDLQVKIKNAIRFLEEGNKVKVALRFRGRQMAHQHLGQETLDRFIEAVSEYSTVEKPGALEGRLLIAVLASKVKK